MSNSLTDEVLEAIRPCGPGLHLFLAAGNPLRKDDGAGSYIAGQLTPSETFKILDAGDAPEGVMDEAIGFQPARMIVVDAADFGGRPGEIRVIPESLMAETALSTHQIPLNAIVKIIAEISGASFSLIGIQPRDVSFGEGLAPAVKASCDSLIAALKGFYGRCNERK